MPHAAIKHREAMMFQGLMALVCSLYLALIASLLLLNCGYIDLKVAGLNLLCLCFYRNPSV